MKKNNKYKNLTTKDIEDALKEIWGKLEGNVMPTYMSPGARELFDKAMREAGKKVIEKNNLKD